MAGFARTAVHLGGSSLAVTAGVVIVAGVALKLGRRKKKHACAETRLLTAQLEVVPGRNRVKLRIQVQGTNRTAGSKPPALAPSKSTRKTAKKQARPGAKGSGKPVKKASPMKGSSTSPTPAIEPTAEAVVSATTRTASSITSDGPSQSSCITSPSTAVESCSKAVDAAPVGSKAGITGTGTSSSDWATAAAGVLQEPELPEGSSARHAAAATQLVRPPQKHVTISQAAAGNSSSSAPDQGSKKMVVADVLRQQIRLMQQNERLKKKLQQKAELAAKQSASTSVPAAGPADKATQQGQQEGPSSDKAAQKDAAKGGKGMEATGGTRKDQAKPKGDKEGEADQGGLRKGTAGEQGAEDAKAAIIKDLSKQLEENHAVMAQLVEENKRNNSTFMDTLMSRLGALEEENNALKEEISSLKGGGNSTPTNGSELGNFKDHLNYLPAPGRVAHSAYDDAGSLRSLGSAARSVVSTYGTACAGKKRGGRSSSSSNGGTLLGYLFGSRAPAPLRSTAGSDAGFDEGASYPTTPGSSVVGLPVKAPPVQQALVTLLEEGWEAPLR